MERYGQSQTVLDDRNLLIIGGSGGPSFFYSDAWVLNLTGDLWKWKQVEVRNAAHAPLNLWCNPVCKVMATIRKRRKNAVLKTWFFRWAIRLLC